MFKVKSSDELKKLIKSQKMPLGSVESSSGGLKINIDYAWIIDEIIKRKGSICSNTFEVLDQLNREQLGLL